MYQVRNINPTRRSVSGQISYFDSFIPYESSLERDFLIFHTFRNDVIDVVAQPISIPFIKNGREYEYTPDFFVQFETGGDDNCLYTKPLLVEVKPENEWKKHWRDWSQKWKAAINYCKEHDFRFAIYDEKRIRHNALNNINYLLRFKNLNCNKYEVNNVLEQVEMMGCTTVEYLLERFFKGSIYRPQGKRVIWYLLATKQLDFDYWGEVNESMEVWRGCR